MSNLITNRASINYNGGNTVETCPVSTNIDKGLDAHKRAHTTDGTIIEESTDIIDGVVGEDRRILYEIELTNFGSIPLTNITIQDRIYITNPDGTINDLTLDPSDIILYPESIKPGDTVTVTKITNGNQVNITLNDPLSYDSTRFVRFTLVLPDTVEIGSIITNTAYVNYSENPSVDPLETETLDIIYTYTALTADKLVTDINGNEISSVLCGDQFKYVLNFTNTGSEIANVDDIYDLLPLEFTVQTNPDGTHPGVSVRLETISGEVTPKVENVDYTVTIEAPTEEGQGMTIAPITGSVTNNIDIPVNSILIVEIQGTATC